MTSLGELGIFKSPLHYAAILSLALVASAGESYFDTGQIAWINMINEL